MNRSIYKNPTQEELDGIASDGQVRAIFTAKDVYTWNPTIASHDEVFKALGFDETAIYAIIDVVRKVVRPVRHSQVQTSPAKAHPLTKEFKVVDKN